MSDTKKYVKGLCGEYVEDWVSTQLAEELDTKDKRIEELEAKQEELLKAERIFIKQNDELLADNEGLRAAMKRTHYLVKQGRMMAADAELTAAQESDDG